MSATGSLPDGVLPNDDPHRRLTVVDVGSPSAGWISLAGDTYTMLVTGDDTAGAYCLIDMRVPDGGGPPPHRHDFEEMFTILSGEIEFTFRGTTTTARQGTTVNIPANAPHNFRNSSGAPAHMLCMCTPAGQDEYFIRVGDRLAGPNDAPPALTPEEAAERGDNAARLAAEYRTEFVD